MLFGDINVKEIQKSGDIYIYMFGWFFLYSWNKHMVK